MVDGKIASEKADRVPLKKRSVRIDYMLFCFSAVALPSCFLSMLKG